MKPNQAQSMLIAQFDITWGTNNCHKAKLINLGLDELENGRYDLCLLYVKIKGRET